MPNQRTTTTQASGRRLRLVTACIAMFTLGFIYGWSVFSVPIAAEFQWAPATLSFTLTVLMWVFCAGGFIGARLCDRTSPRTTLIASAASIFAAFALCALLARADAPVSLYVTYGLFGGLGVGMAYTVTMGTALAWFPDKAGTASGILLFCYGVSTMILSSVVAWLCSFMNWRVAFPLIAAVMAIVLVLAALALRRPTAQELALLPHPAGKQAPSGDNGSAAHKADAAAGDAKGTPQGKTTAQMLRTPAFWSYALWMMCMCTISLGYSGHSNQMALAAGTLPALAVAFVGVYSVCSGAGRFLHGLIFDAWGTARTILFVAFNHTLASVLLIAGLLTQSVALMGVALAFAGFAVSGTTVCGSSFTAVTFGSAHYAQNLAVLNLALIPAALAGPLIMSLSVGTAGTYVGGLSVDVALGIAGILLALATRHFLKRNLTTEGADR